MAVKDAIQRDGVTNASVVVDFDANASQSIDKSLAFPARSSLVSLSISAISASIFKRFCFSLAAIRRFSCSLCLSCLSSGESIAILSSVKNGEHQHQQKNRCFQWLKRPKITLDTGKVAHRDLNVRFLVETCIRVERIALPKSGSHRLIWRQLSILASA